MSDLVQRLANGTHLISFGRAGETRGTDLKAAIDRQYVLVKFTETRGGTELGIPLDVAACQLDRADFGALQGYVHLEGLLTLDYVPVRVIAELNLATFEGQGRLQIVAQPAPAA
jgi:hypothetical protein